MTAPPPWPTHVEPEPTFWQRLRRPGRLRALVVVAIMSIAAGGAVYLAGQDPWWGAEVRTTLHGDVEWPEQPEGALEGPPTPVTDVDLDAGNYDFIDTQTDGTSPVTFDPCVPIRVEVNERTAFHGARQALLEAIDVIEEATGLTFVVEGETDEPPSPDRDIRDVDGFAPLLIAWSDEEEWPELEGNVIGLARSDLAWRDGTRWFVTGTIVLDGPQLEDFMNGGLGLDVVRATIIHELAHILGLDHVEDEGEIMHPQGSPDRVELGPGDRAGLALVGQGECVDY